MLIEKKKIKNQNDFKTFSRVNGYWFIYDF